jgi:vacuolar-type H+-ATPase subunit E/Vma4
VALDDLLTRLRRQAEDQATALVDAGRHAAEEIAEQAGAAAAAVRAERRRALEAGLQAEAAVAIEAARSDAALRLLQARRQTIDAILARLERLLPETAADPRYLASAAEEFDRALDVLDGRPAVVSASTALAERVLARASASVEIRADPAVAGFRVRSTDGRIEIDATLDARLRRLTPALAIELARAMDAPQ